MTRLRWRLARALVGPFVTLPEHDGVWVVSRQGRGQIVFEADKFRLKTSVNIAPQAFGSIEGLESYGLARRTGRFVGTVKYR